MTCRSSTVIWSANDGEEAFAAPRNPSVLRACVSATLLAMPVYSYIVTSIKTTADFQLRQKGSGPNFDGGRITLCTCKHKDRATIHRSTDEDDPWKNVWVAGFTSRSEIPSRGLAYLMCVERSFLDQRALWHFLPGRCRRAKSASESQRGDLFQPKASARNDPHNPANYCLPVIEHVHSNKNAWHHDVMPWGRRCLPHRLLLGQPAQSYRWMNVSMILKPDAIGVTAHHHVYPSLDEFIRDLQEFDP